MILIVDDKSENIYSLKKLLESRNFKVDTAFSGEEALKKILKNQYALIILDVQMPDMDGFEVAEAITGYSKSKDVPIIFLSAYNHKDKKYIIKGYESGAIDFVLKPIDTDILLLKVKTLQRLYYQTHELNVVQAKLLKEIEIRKQAELKKDEFLSIASHELKTPLTSIKAYTQLLERSLDNNDKSVSRIYLERSKVQLNKLESLIADLLDISKIESGELKLNKAPFNFNEMLLTTIDIIRQTHNNTNIIIKNRAIEEDVFGDIVRIEQVIINFLTNAIKYSEEGSLIEINAFVEEEHLQLHIIDRGIGIPAEQQKNIFNKFFRVEESSFKFQGLGIGLYICSEIIKQHGGKVGVLSDVNKGSDFYFTIPLHNK